MKKILVTLLVLALCTPAMAATVVIDDGTPDDGIGTITVTREGTENIVGLALEIAQTAGGNIADVTVDTATFNIFPDAAYTLESGTPGSYTYGAGTPIANPAAAGEVGISNSIAVSVGALNGAATAGATGAASVVITVTVDTADTTIQVQENALRGGIVLTDGSGEDITSGGGVVSGVITLDTAPPECVNSSASFYADWVAWGSPDCWCYAKNCKGDINGANQGSAFAGFVAVGTTDLNLFLPAYNIKEPPKGPGISAGQICADISHSQQGSAFAGFVRVGTTDLNTFLANYNIKEPPKGPGIADCSGPDYNFFTTP